MTWTNVSQIPAKMVVHASMSLDPITVYATVDMWGTIVKVRKENGMESRHTKGCEISFFFYKILP